MSRSEPPDSEAAAPRKPLLPTLAKKLTLSFTTLAVLVVALELVARAKEPGPFSFFDTNPYRETATEDVHFHVPGFEGRWDSTWYEIDERGFRGPSRQPTFAEGEARVMCVGDSCTFGKGVLETDTWPRRLETLMRADDPTALAFNLGVNGGDGRHYAALLDAHADEIRPTHVVVGFNINDFPNAIRKADEKVFGKRKLRKLIPDPVRDALGRSALYRTARAIYYDANKEADWKAAEEVAKRAASVPVESEIWSVQRECLERIIATAAEHDATVVVMLFPFESQVFLETYDDRPIRRLEALCGELGVRFVDLATAFREAKDTSGRLFLKGDRFHPTASGYRIVAERVLEALRGN